MNRINKSTIEIDCKRYYQILQTLGINKNFSANELFIIQTEMVNEATRKLGKSSFDEAHKRSGMGIEAGAILWRQREKIEAWKNKNSSIDRYYQELGLSKNITLDEAMRFGSKISEEQMELSGVYPMDVVACTRNVIRGQMIGEIINVLRKEECREKKGEENNKRIKAQKELNDALCREGIANSKGANKEMLEAVRRIALTNEEAVKKVDELRKNGGRVVDNKTSVSTSNEKQNISEQQLTTVNQVSQTNEETNKSNIAASNQNNKQLENNNNSSNQNRDNINVDKDTLIAQLEAEISRLKKNLDPNNTEQKTILAQKEAKLNELKGEKQNKNQELNSKNNNSKENNLTSILLPIGIVSVLLLAVSAFWIIKKRKSLKKVK